ncbi:MAG: hypothetical protein VB025_13770 [Sphaerochaeta sp.]|nr:hypothetical protein [Sphaerochaeta sp.]
MKEHSDKSTKYSLGIVGAFLVMLGTLFPSIFAIALQPKQPFWENAEVYVQNYHGIQSLPFYFGFLLIGGSLMLLLAVYLLSSSPSLPLFGLLSGIIGSAVVCINYIIQTTYIPAIVEGFTPEHAILIQALSMANPTSIAWAFEMWGYGFLGLGTWLAASFFGRTGIEGFARILFILNGILSIVGAVWTALDLGWVLTLPGYICFGLWNLLYLVLSLVAFRVFFLRKKAM